MTEPIPCSKYRRPLVPQVQERRPTCLPVPRTLEQLVALQSDLRPGAFWAGIQAANSAGCHLTREVLEEAIRLVEEQEQGPMRSQALILPLSLIKDNPARRS